MVVPYASASPARRRRAAGVLRVAVALLTPRILREVPSVGPRHHGRVVGVPADVLDIEPSRDVAASHPSPFAATRAIRISTQVKVEKKDESIEAMRKLMGGAADEEEEEGN